MFRASVCYLSDIIMKSAAEASLFCIDACYPLALPVIIRQRFCATSPTKRAILIE